MGQKMINLIRNFYIRFGVVAKNGQYPTLTAEKTLDLMCLLTKYYPQISCSGKTPKELIADVLNSCTLAFQVLPNKQFYYAVGDLFNE